MKHASARSGLFLIEMILVILFFALTAAVYARLFSAAYLTGRNSRDLTQAVMISTNLAEAFYANGGDVDAMGALFPEAEATPGENGTAPLSGLRLFYDKDWMPLSASAKADAAYEAVLSLTEDLPYRNARILVLDSAKSGTGMEEDAIYRLELIRYEPEEVTP